jgi:hypothetical protein
MKTFVMVALLMLAMGAKLTSRGKAAPAATERPTSHAPIAAMPAHTAEGWITAAFAGR